MVKSSDQKIVVPFFIPRRKESFWFSDLLLKVYNAGYASFVELNKSASQNSP